MFGLNIIDTASVANSGLSAAKIAEIKVSINAAAEAWGRYIDAPNSVIDIELTIDDIPGSALATAGASYFSSGGAPWESRVTEEMAADADVSPGTKDGTLRIDLPRLLDPSYYFFDDSFEVDPVGLANPQFDFMSVMVHELAHVLGLSNPSNFTTPFGTFVQTTGGIDYFTGANAVAANGGNNVELTGSHLVSEDLLDPTTTSGIRGIITPVHIGIWEDLGIPILQATSGADTLYGFEAFDDTINASGGNDTVYGLTGDDTLNGAGGNDTLVGGGGADTLNGGGGFDWVSYDSSVNGVTVNLGANTASGGDAAGDSFSGIERVLGSRENDTITGNSTGNFLRGNDGNDTLNGAGGSDLLRGDAGADALNGGGGFDWAYYSGSNAAVTVNLQTNTGSGGHATGDTYVNIERVFGSRYDDTITGDNGVNYLRGALGDDTLNGGGGNDLLRGDAGADLLNGNGGNDWAYYVGSTAVTVNLGTNTGIGGDAQGDTYVSIERVYGSTQNDSITGNSAANYLRGNAGNDTLYGGGGSDLLQGDAGADHLVGGAGSDWAYYAASSSAVTVNLGANSGSGGDAAGDTFSGVERIYGSRHDDTLTGNSGVNYLLGNVGDDVLKGVGGNDTLRGDQGDDTFVFTANDGDDVVVDFEDGSDLLEVPVANFNALTINNSAAGAVVDYGSGTVTLTGINESALTSADFIFS